MLLRALARVFSEDRAVDLGTANTLVYVRGQGIVLNEPSVVAISHKDHSLLAVGEEAKAMLGRAPGSIGVFRPLRHGVIADFDVTEKMLNYFIRKVHRRQSLVHPRIVVTVPSEITQVLEQAPPELAADMVDTGITLTGGGALLRGLDRLLHAETALPITLSDDPLTSVVRGAGKLLDTLDLLRRVAIPA